MKWKYKAILQNAIASLPMSDGIYYAVQRTFGDLRRSRFDPMEWISGASEMIGWLKAAGRRIAGKQFLEVGTGRALGMPLALWLCGAGATVTVDLNRYLSEALVTDCIRYLRRNAVSVREVLQRGDDDGGLAERLDQLLAFSGDLGLFLDLIHVRYLAPADASHLPFPDQSFDFHFSYAVLEHVPGPEILAILREARRILRPGGMVLHAIDLSDHFWYSDTSIERINCLRFSQREWRRWAGNKYMYHNRLRIHELLDLFAEAGVWIQRESRTLHERSLQAVKNGFPLDAQFRSIPAEELAVTSMRILGSFSAPRDDGETATAHTVEWERIS